MQRYIMTPQSDSLPGNQPTLKPTRAARAIGILTVVGFRILVSRVEVGLDLESQRARGRQALPGNSIQQQSAIHYDLQYR